MITSPKIAERPKAPLQVETLKHAEATRKNIPTAEYQFVMSDADHNEESFFVRHAYFLGANDLYQSLKTTPKAEFNEEAWAALNGDTSWPFDKPQSGRIEVNGINHLGDEVMKAFKIA